MAALAMNAGGLNAPAAMSFRVPALPWALNAADERRFRRIARNVGIVTVLLVLLMLFAPLSPPQRAEMQPLPAPMARLLLEQQAPKPPPPAPLAEATKPEAAPEAAPDKPAPIKPVKPNEAPVPEARNPQPNKSPGEVAVDNARRKASGVGLLAMKDQLAELHSAPAAAQLRQDIKPGPGVGTGTGAGVGAGTEQGVPLRAMVTSNATGATGAGGGVNTASFSRDTGGGGLAGRGSTLVEGVAGGGGGGGVGSGGARAGGSTVAGDGVAAGKGGTLTKGSSGKASRSLEDVKLVFERNKGAIYAIYNRALRDDPALQGKVVLELKIAPTGEVSGLRLVSSELKNEELEKRLLARIRSFDFGAKDVEVLVVTWPVDFLPS
jgi:outer membrane biosynthesis protein TonB